MGALHFQKFWNPPPPSPSGGGRWDNLGLCVGRDLESTPPHGLIEIDENETFLIRKLIRKWVLSIFRNSGTP